jgi:hypothetical protein
MRQRASTVGGVPVAGSGAVANTMSNPARLVASATAGFRPGGHISHPRPVDGYSDSPMEREAERIADEAMRMPAPAMGHGHSTPGYCTSRGGRGVLADMEHRFGHDFSAVKVHTDVVAAKAARMLNARAFTIGRDIYFSDGALSPTFAGRRLLAHELAHTIQASPRGSLESSAGGASRSMPISQRLPATAVARSPDEVREATAADRREVVVTAARWLEALAEQVRSMRQMASVALATTVGSAAAPRAFHQRMNEETVGRLLRNAISVFEAQRRASLDVGFPEESPEQTQLGEAFSRAMEQLGLAMEEARANAANLAPTVRESEEADYAANYLRWLEANPTAALAAGIRTTFTRTEVDLSQRRHQQMTTELGNLVANVHQYNLAGDGAARLRTALLNSVYRLVQDPATGTTRSERDATLAATIQPVLDSLDGIEWAVGSAIDRLVRAEQLTRSFIADTAANQSISAALQTHFATRDAGYAGMLADRLARMARELRGEGALAVHARNPSDPHCGVGSVGGGLSVTAAHAEPNHFYFCSDVRIGDEERVSTVVHETAHAVIPALGALGSVSASTDGPDDRAYTSDRVYARLSTEEALDNAESYSFYIDDVLGLRISRDSPPTDEITGCSDAESVRDAIARATYRIRLAAMWAGQTFDGETPGHPPQHVVDVIRHGFPGADDARANEIRVHLRNLAGRLDYYLPVRCRPATDREARAGALVYSPAGSANATAVTANSARYSPDALRICPAWFGSSVEVREDSLTSILVLRYRSAVALADVPGIVGIVRFVQEQAHPSVAGRSLAQHQAADAPLRPAP